MQEVYLVQHLLKNLIQSKRFCKRRFIIDGEISCTYFDFFNMCNCLSYYISKELKVLKGDRILIIIDNCLEFYVSFFASIMLGGIAVPVSSKSSAEKIVEIATDCGATAILCSSSNVQNKCIGIAKHYSVMNVGRYCTGMQFGELDLGLNIIDTDPAMIIYTSGSTGKNKGIVCSHLNILSATRSIVSYLKLKDTDVVLNALPPFFDYGLYQFFLCLYCGAELVLVRNFVFSDIIVKCIKENGITVLPIMPTIAASLSEYISKANHKSSEFDSIRIVTSTGAKLYVSQIKNLKIQFRNADIFSMYGLTECKRVAYLDPCLIDIKPDSVGKAMPNVSVDIVDEYGNSVPQGSIGTLVVKGSNVCIGYWNDTELTDKTFVTNEFNQRCLITNDLFRMDEDGDLYYIGRTDDIVKCSGFRISLHQISQKIMEISGVRETFIEAKDDERLGKKLVAYIVLEINVFLTVNQIRKELLKLLENSVLCPQEILIVESLPITENGKVYRNKNMEVKDEYSDNKK